MSEVNLPTSTGGAGPGKPALARSGPKDWPATFERLSDADRAGRSSGEELETLAIAAFFAGRADESLAIEERSYTAHLDAGHDLRAAYLALDIGRRYGQAGQRAIATAWARRAERLIGKDGETYAHGYLALIRSEMAGSSGDLDDALAQAERAVAIGDRADDADLRANAMANLGELKIAAGSAQEGFALIEEASIAAVNGELTPITSGITTCRMISACRDMTDYRRATEWIEATEKYCEMQSLSGFPGVCRIHRAEVTAVGGSWDRAEEELERATAELTSFNAIPPQADGFYAIGDIRRSRGDFDGAEAALREAHRRGRTPQPALALIRLAQGKVAAASSAIAAALDERTWDRWGRARLLPAQVEIAVAAGDVARARMAVDELNETIPGYPSPALEASRRTALARVLLAEGEATGAVRELREATKGWRDVGAPYELARSRVVLSRALRTLGDEDDADLELRAAHDAFVTLGARVDLDAVEREQRDIEDLRSGPLTARRTFMFTDIVGSTNLAEALGDQAWERLLRWHDDMIRRSVAASRGSIVNSTGDGFFVAFETARAGIDCAIGIQRALAAQRADAGSTLSVRVGLHTAEANQRGSDYSGVAVHVAARVGALATGGEILATADTVMEAGDVSTSAFRSTGIRGVSTPVELASVSWA